MDDKNREPLQREPVEIQYVPCISCRGIIFDVRFMWPLATHTQWALLDSYVKRQKSQIVNEIHTKYEN